MDNLEIIEKLKNDLPQVLAVIGYGSGIYKQTGYNQNEKPDKDVIIVTEDFKDFLIEDYEKNPHHFSDDFDKHILIKKKEKDKFYSNVGCLKFYHNNIHFKAMIISQKALEEDLKTWKYFGMSGRLTKPILYGNISQELDKAIQNNRNNILITALLLNKQNTLTPNELYNTSLNSTDMSSLECASVSNQYQRSIMTQSLLTIYESDDLFAFALVGGESNLCLKTYTTSLDIAFYDAKNDKTLTEDEIKEKYSITEEEIQTAVTNDITQRNIDEAANYETNITDYHIYIDNDGQVCVYYLQPEENVYYSVTLDKNIKD